MSEPRANGLPLAAEVAGAVRASVRYRELALQLGLYAALIALVMFFSWATPYFFTVGNFFADILPAGWRSSA